MILAMIFLLLALAWYCGAKVRTRDYQTWKPRGAVRNSYDRVFDFLAGNMMPWKDEWE